MGKDYRPKNIKMDIWKKSLFIFLRKLKKKVWTNINSPTKSGYEKLNYNPDSAKLLTLNTCANYSATFTKYVINLRIELTHT